MNRPDFHQWRDDLTNDVQFGYVSDSLDSPRHFHPRVVLNSSEASVLRVIREEIRKCQTFVFSVAFVSPNALAMLKTDLIEFRGKGTIITSDYLAFNSPQAFAELISLGERGFDVRLHNASAFHPKGYVFEHEETISAMVGSANLTANALVRNHEWNLLVSTSKSGDLAAQLRELVEDQIRQSVPITQAWLDGYAQNYTPPTERPRRPGAPEPGDDSGTVLDFPDPPEASGLPVDPSNDSVAPLLLPNRMQREALTEIDGFREAGHDRALVISATGTGKTILSALSVRSASPDRMLFVVHREQILDRTIQEYRRVVPGDVHDFGKLSGTRKDMDAKFLFATVQTLSRPGVLDQFSPEHFDFVVVDEAHRATAAGHRRVMEYFQPKFMLGMTATPERLDGDNVFELFNYNVAYEIRLNQALEADMLSPFHYYGVTDVTFDDGTTTSDESDIARLTSKPRVDHILRELEKYGQAGIAPRGLIFVSRKEEARVLSDALNARTLRGHALRTIALTGEDTVPYREDVVRRLESGHLDYIVTVDVFNEGVDIPSVNQVLMLRQTASPTIFVQQLGRGLRKAVGKEYLVVIDFIGNYANNYMIPIALFGDSSLNKESLRRNLIAAEERGVVAGISSVQFDRISHERILRAVTNVNLGSMRMLKTALEDMQNRVGRAPDLWDFVRFDSADPVVLATARENYLVLLARTLKQDFDLTPAQHRFLALLSHEVLTAKRPHDAAVVRLLIDRGPLELDQVRHGLTHAGHATTARVARSAVETLTLSSHAKVDVRRYVQPAATFDDGVVELHPEFVASYTGSNAFRHAVDDLLRTAAHVVAERFDVNRPFTPGRQYSRKEALRLLTLPRSWYSTVYGYKVDTETRTCPAFVTLHKGDDISATTAYEDAIIDRHTMVWYSKSQRNVHSPTESLIVRNEVDIHMFVQKEGADGADHFYLGQPTVTSAEDSTMRKDDGATVPVVRMVLTFDQAIPASLVDYFHPVVIDA